MLRPHQVGSEREQQLVLFCALLILFLTLWTKPEAAWHGKVLPSNACDVRRTTCVHSVPAGTLP